VRQRHLGWKAGVPAFAVAGSVAASRLASNRHYSSDIAFSAILGTLAGPSVTPGAGRVRFTVEPVASPGGAGIAFRRVASRARQLVVARPRGSGGSSARPVDIRRSSPLHAARTAVRHSS